MSKVSPNTALQIAQYGPNLSQCGVRCRVLCNVCTVLCTLFTVHCSLYTVLCTLFTVPYTIRDLGFVNYLFPERLLPLSKVLQHSEGCRPQSYTSCLNTSTLRYLLHLQHSIGCQLQSYSSCLYTSTLRYLLHLQHSNPSLQRCQTQSYNTPYVFTPQH